MVTRRKARRRPCGRTSATVQEALPGGAGLSESHSLGALTRLPKEFST